MLTKMNKKLFIILSVLIFAVILFISLWWYPAVKDINSRYPDYSVTEVAGSETANINEISLKADNLRFYKMSDFQKNYMSESSADSVLTEVFNANDIDDTEVALVDYFITYNGESETTASEIIDRYIIYLQSGFLSFSYDMLFLSSVNTLNQIPQTLSNGDSFKVTLPYFIDKKSNSIKSIDDLTENGFSAVVNYYPDRYFIEL